MSKPKFQLKDFERYIKAKAWGFAKRAADVEDFQQIGRLAAHQALQDDPNATRSYVYKRIDWRMIDYYKRSIYKHPQELSANHLFGHLLWGDAIDLD